MTKVLFIHRSVGNNLIEDGGLYALLRERQPDVELNDFNQNTGIIRDFDGLQKTELAMPGGDTHPSNYAELFSDTPSKMLDFVMGFDVIVIKSCYPNSNIESDAELENIKKHYESTASFFTAHPNKRLIIFTSPPLQPLMTNKQKAHRAKELALWLTSQDFGDNITVFDFFSLLANDNGVLKKEYRRLLPFDSHSNRKANKSLAPLVSELLARSRP
jgi:hypothetical protein